MEEQDSILLQKKMILIMSIFIFALTIGITYKTNKNDIMEIKLANEKKENKIEVIATNLDVEKNKIKTIDELFDKMVTVYEKSDIEDDIISIEQVTYTAQKEVIEEESTNDETPKVNYVSYKSLAENNPPEEYISVYEVKATAYCLCQKCCGKSPSSPSYGNTASGVKIIPGTGMKVIAVDPSVIPLGSKVYVQGLNGAWDYGYALAADTGSAIKSMKIDLYMDTHSEALSWGSKKVNVYIVE